MHRETALWRACPIWIYPRLFPLHVLLFLHNKSSNHFNYNFEQHYISLELDVFRDNIFLEWIRG